MCTDMAKHRLQQVASQLLAQLLGFKLGSECAALVEVVIAAELEARGREERRARRIARLDAQPVPNAKLADARTATDRQYFGTDFLAEKRDHGARFCRACRRLGPGANQRQAQGFGNAAIGRGLNPWSLEAWWQRSLSAQAEAAAGDRSQQEQAQNNAREKERRPAHGVTTLTKRPGTTTTRRAG